MSRGEALATVELESFDRQYRERVTVQRPDRYRLLEALPAERPRVARGGGVSYVAASFGDGAISQDMAAFDRLLGFDPELGHLAVEAGAPVARVQDFALAHGWYLPVVPGHPRASIGGCIAADVHGKNPARDGTFRNHVVALELLTAGGRTTVASPTRQPELFAATCGGLGLTGVITRVRLRLSRPPAGLVLRRVPVADLAEAARVLRQSAKAPLLYGWHDGRPGQFGRGVIRIGLAADTAVTGPARARQDLPARIRPLPFTLWNRGGIALANAWLARRWCRPGDTPMALAEALFPLNRAARYFAGYGRSGLVEAQWLVPHPRFEAFAAALTDTVRRLHPRIALISSKLFAGAAGGLRFDGEGVALALHLPAPAEPGQRAFLEALAGLAIAHGGRPNLIKDSTLDAATLRRALPGLDAARARIRAHNEGGLQRSELARRLGL